MLNTTTLLPSIFSRSCGYMPFRLHPRRARGALLLVATTTKSRRNLGTAAANGVESFWIRVTPLAIGGAPQVAKMVSEKIAHYPI